MRVVAALRELELASSARRPDPVVLASTLTSAKLYLQASTCHLAYRSTLSKSPRSFRFAQRWLPRADLSAPVHAALGRPRRRCRRAFSMRFSSAVSLSIALNEPTLIVDPSAAQPTVLSGRVLLALSVEAHVPCVKVQLCGTATVGKTSWCCLDLSSELHVGRRLDAGEHSLDFRIEVPQQVATTEGCEHGTVAYVLSAVAPGLGAFGGDARISQPCRIHAWYSSNFALAALEARTELFIDGLGPIAIGAFSYALCVTCPATHI